MCRLILIAGVCLVITSLASSSRLVCYYNRWADRRDTDGQLKISDIDVTLCTHVIFTNAEINNANELVPYCSTDYKRYQTFNGLKTRNPQLKTLLAVGGETFNTKLFSMMASTPQNRSKFTQSAVTLLRTYGFDGITLDWRFPGGAGSQPGDKQRFTSLCKALNEAFVAEATQNNQQRLLVTASVSAEKEIIDAGYEVAQIARYLDFINVLTFDFHGPWETVTGHNSPLYKGSHDTGDKIYSNTDYAMRYWRDQGAPTQKLNLGLAAYGRVFTLSTANTDVGAPASGPGEEGRYTITTGLWSYYETCLYTEGLPIYLLPDQKVPYAVTENQWVGFDNLDSLDTKVNYLQKNNFGGACVWSMDLDDFRGEFCNQGNNPFITHLHNLLVPDFPDSITSTTINPTTKPKTLTTTGIATTTPSPTTRTPTTTIRTPATTTKPPTTPVTTTTTKATTSIPARITSTTTITTPATKPGVVSLTFCNGKSDGYYSNPTDLARFYRCYNQLTYPYTCQSGLVYKDYCKCCDWPTFPRLTTTTPSPTTTTPTTTIRTPATKPGVVSLTFCNGKSDGYYSNPTDSARFYRCYNQLTYPYTCQSGLVYKDSCKCCDWPPPPA